MWRRLPEFLLICAACAAAVFGKFDMATFLLAGAIYDRVG